MLQVNFNLPTTNSIIADSCFAMQAGAAAPLSASDGPHEAGRGSEVWRCALGQQPIPPFCRILCQLRKLELRAAAARGVPAAVYGRGPCSGAQTAAASRETGDPRSDMACARGPSADLECEAQALPRQLALDGALLAALFNVCFTSTIVNGITIHLDTHCSYVAMCKPLMIRSQDR